jgi:hypothetical protein
MPLPGARVGPPSPPSELPVADGPPDPPVRSEPPGSGAPKEASSSGKWSLILGVVAISSFAVGLLLFAYTAALIFNGLCGQSGVWLNLVGLGSVCFGSVLSLPGMALGLASLEQKGRSKGAGVAGCWINGLILGFWLCLLAARFLFGGNRGGYPGPIGPPSHGPAPPAPPNGVDFFRFR